MPAYEIISIFIGILALLSPTSVYVRFLYIHRHIWWNEMCIRDSIRNKCTDSIVKEVVYETDYFSQGNKNFPYILGVYALYERCLLYTSRCV